jgi:hypothetical protein
MKKNKNIVNTAADCSMNGVQVKAHVLPQENINVRDCRFNQWANLL